MQLERNKSYEQWDSMTAKFAGAANLPFLLLQLPQIVLNTQNLLAGNKSALLAVPWLVLNFLCLIMALTFRSVEIVPKWCYIHPSYI